MNCWPAACRWCWKAASSEDTIIFGNAVDIVRRHQPDGAALAAGRRHAVPASGVRRPCAGAQLRSTPAGSRCCPDRWSAGWSKPATSTQPSWPADCGRALAQPRTAQAAAPWPQPGPTLIDVKVFGEIALFAAPRNATGRPVSIPASRPAGAARRHRRRVRGGTRRTAAGTLAMRGPMVPSTPSAQCRSRRLCRSSR